MQTVIVGRGHMKKKLLKIADELGVSESLFIEARCRLKTRSTLSFSRFGRLPVLL